MATGWPMKTTYANGDVYSAGDVNDITGTINLLGSSVAYAAGKNKIINGDFGVNQRAFTSTTTSATYGFDRFRMIASDGTSTYTAQTFTAGAAPVAGYEAKNFAQLASTGQTLTTAQTRLDQPIEDVRTFANETVTVSFWAKATSGTPSVSVELQQYFGSGGSPSATVNTFAGKVTLTTSWARYSVTIAVPSISGKTIGTANDAYLGLNIFTSAGSTFNSRTGTLGIQTTTIAFWGVQIESGSTATAFQTATGTIQGELAACERYYETSFDIGQTPASNATFQGAILTAANNGGFVPNNVYAGWTFKTKKRAIPTITLLNPANASAAASTVRIYSAGGSGADASSAVIWSSTNQVNQNITVVGTLSSALVGFAYVASAEL
jgi:hypothetical protein